MEKLMFRNGCAIVLALLLTLAPSLKATPHLTLARSASLSSSKPESGPAQYVNPFIGTANSPLPDYLGGNGSGNTFPGATMPFGMVQWSPDTEKGFGKDERGSYLYADTAIRGFSLTHLSGPGCPVFGDVPLMPLVGGVKTSPATDPGAYLAKFTHDKEKASPGFYEVTLENGIRVNLTATWRTGQGVFTYPSSSDAGLLIDVGRNASGVTTAEALVSGDRQITGSLTSGGFCGARNKYKLYFVLEFDRDFKSTGTWHGANVSHGSSAVEGAGTGLYVTFDTTVNRSVRVRVGLSYVRAANALLNLRVENPGWDFDAVRESARNVWNDALGRIKVSGGTTSEKQVFYTALYHTLLHPNIFSDANGEYLGFDDRVQVARKRTQYTNFSGWDIYRSESPLLAWLFPKEASDMAQSLVAFALQGGGLPIWPVANDESGQMYGDPSVPIIVSSYAFGARDFDTVAALKAMIKGATDPATKSKTYPERNGLADYLKYGYIPMEQKGLRGSPSVALEYEIADFALAQFARAQGDAATYREMMRRAQFWTRIFDPQTRYIRGRWADGSWLPGFDFKAQVYDRNLPWKPESHKSYVEGNATQYTWMIPHNMRALFERIGGNEAVIKRLDSFFTELNAGPNRPYFFIGNEPVFAVPWLYNYAGAPWKTQAITRRALTELFTNDPGGIPGNDDLGATSSWVVFSSIGLYPVIPGVGGFSINSPLFPQITVRLKGGKRLKITGEGASATTPYVRELSLNGRPYNSTWLPYEKIANGATLRFKLGNTPNTGWATEASSTPPSFPDGMENESRPAQ
jgi:predicted alpha-1,2-mannosidase